MPPKKNNGSKNKTKNKNNSSGDNNINTNTITGLSQIPSTSSMAMASTPKGLAFPTGNPFNALHDEDPGEASFLNTSRRTLPAIPGEHPLPTLPDIPNVENLTQTQKTFLMLQMADKLQLQPEITAPASTAGVTLSAAAAIPPAAGPQSKTLTPHLFKRGRDRSGSENRKRKAEQDSEANKRPRQQESNRGYKTENVFLSGIKGEIKKNGIVFKREFSREVPDIKLKSVFFTRSGSVGLTPDTPHDCNALLALDWSKHPSLGNDIKATPDRAKMVDHIAVITGVDPELDDNTLKEELEDRNNLKVTNIKRLFNKEKQTPIYRVKLWLENEETLKRVLKDGVLLGYTKHKCIPSHDRNNPVGADKAITQCFRCQKWDPKHGNSNCQGVRACLWCAADHFHKECPLFQTKNKTAAKCANCQGAHASWDKNCPSYIEASKRSPQLTAARVVSSSSLTKADLDTAMTKLWHCLAGVMATVVTRSILDLRAEEKKATDAGTRVNTAELVMMTAKGTARTMNEFKPLQVSKPIEAAEMQETVWKALFPTADFPGSSKASLTPQANDKTNSSLPK